MGVSHLFEDLLGSEPCRDVMQACEADEFLFRNHIDERAASVLRALPEELQRKVTGSITRAANPSAVLLSRIRRVLQNQNMPLMHQMPQLLPLPQMAGENQQVELPQLLDADLRTAIQMFLEKHGIDAEGHAIWELTEIQQRIVISSGLPADDVNTALMARIKELQGVPPVKPMTPEEIHEADRLVLEFLQRHGITLDVATELRNLPIEQQREIVAADLKGAKKPSAVLLSRINRAKAQGRDILPQRDEVVRFLKHCVFDEDACRSFLELRPEQQNDMMQEDYGRYRNPSAYLMSRIRAMKESKPPFSSDGFVHDRRPPRKSDDVLEAFIRRHGIDEGGREALHQLPPLLQLQVLAHDQEIGSGGRNPSQHVVSLVGKAWASAFGRPQVDVGLEPLKGEEELEEPPLKKRKEEEDALEHLPLAVEGFLRLNGIDAKSCRAMRRLPPSVQQQIIGLDLRQCRNPSAFLWAQIQKVSNGEKPDTPRSVGHDLVPVKQPSLPVARTLPPPLKEKPKGEIFFVLHGHGPCVPALVEVGSMRTLLTAGRASQNDIILKAQHVSKRHAEFHLDLGGDGVPALLIRDVSSNGTWVQGEKIRSRQRIPLLPGDVVSFLPGVDAPAFRVDLPGAEQALAVPVVPSTGGEVSEWIRSIGGGGKLSQRIIEEVEDSYDHLRQIWENYRRGDEDKIHTHIVHIIHIYSIYIIYIYISKNIIE